MRFPATGEDFNCFSTQATTGTKDFDAAKSVCSGIEGAKLACPLGDMDKEDFNNFLHDLGRSKAIPSFIF